MEQPVATYAPDGQAAPPLAQPVQPRKRQPSGWGKLWAAFGLGVAAYVILIAIQIIVVLRAGAEASVSNEAMAVSELVAGVCALLFILALGGKRIARPSLKGMGTAWKAALWLFIADGLFVVLEAIEVALGFEQIEVAADWPVRVGILALLCFGIGLFEETTMRGLCLNGLLARMGRTRGGVYGAVILSSFFFGLLHFDPLAGFDDPILVAQNCMKVLQSGMCGYLLAAILVNTRNIWAVALIHGANDFMLLFIANGLTDASVTTDYVHSGDEGLAVLGVYIILCLLYLPFLFIGRRLINEASPWRGDFYHYGETAATPQRTAPAPANAPAPTAAVAPTSSTVFPTPTHATPPTGYPVAERVDAPVPPTPTAPAPNPSSNRPNGPRYAAPSATEAAARQQQARARAALADRLPRI